MTIRIDKHGRINASIWFILPLPASVVWGQMRDLPQFITIDPLHRRVHLLDRKTIFSPRRRGSNQSHDSMNPVGTHMVIEHRLFGIGPNRHGRILRWKEGSGYAFSDLSRRGNSVGFPHICAYTITPVSECASALTFAARGKWTTRFIPRPLIKLWLFWVLTTTALCIRIHFYSTRSALLKQGN